MKRLWVSAAVLPLAYAVGAHADTTISSTSTPVRTSTAAGGQPDNLVIGAGAAVSPAAPGAAVTLDSSNTVTNNGAISFTDVNNATGVLILGGNSSALSNPGTITVTESYARTDSNGDGILDGAFAQGTGRYGVRVIGPGAFTGSIQNTGTITVVGNDSAGISVETPLLGAIAHSGTIAVTGDRTIGLAAGSVSGGVSVTGAVTATGAAATAVSLGDVGGTVLLQSAITATGYSSTTRGTDAQRATLLSSDLSQGGPAVRIAGDIGGGVLLEHGAADGSTPSAALVSYGSAPALDIGADRGVTLGMLGTGDSAFGLVIKGSVTGSGLNDAVSATAVRIGQANGGATNVQGGVNVLGGSISATAYGATATGLLINPASDVPALRVTGSIGATSNGGAQDARAVVDLSGSLALVQNSGVIGASVTGTAVTGRAVALDLSANAVGAVVQQFHTVSTDAPLIGGDIVFGPGADRLEVSAGKVTGAVSFGGGADVLSIDGGAAMTGRILDADNRLALTVTNGLLALTSPDSVGLSALTVGSAGVLKLTVNGTTGQTSRFNVAGPATLADGAQVQISLISISRGSQSYQIVQAQSLQVGQTSLSLSGAPYVYVAGLRPDAAAGALYVDIRPKTVGELSLNRPEAEAYDAVFAALGNDARIDAAVLAQTTRPGFLGLYDQMLPDHSGGSLLAAAAISQAVSAATAEPMAIGQDAYHGLWAQEIQFGMRRTGDPGEGFRAHGFGLAGGADMLFNADALGLGLSFVTSDHRDRDAAAGEQTSMNILGGSLYWRHSQGPLQAHARAGLGYAWFKGDRALVGDGLDLTTQGKWHGWTAEADASASYRLSVGRFYARPEIAVDYLRLDEAAYQEGGGGPGFDLHVDGRKSDLLTGEALVAMGARFGDEIYLAPELSLGYRERIAGQPAATTAQFQGGSDFTVESDPAFKGGAVVRVGVKGGSRQVVYALDAGGVFDRRYEDYDARVTVRFQF